MRTTAAGSQALAQARDLFPGAARLTYMNVSVRSLLCTPVREAVERHMQARIEDGGDKAEMFRNVETARGRFAELIGADADEIAYTKNVSEGLNIIAAALPWEPGDNLVLCPELEHPNNVYPWLNLERRLDVEVRTVPPHDGFVPIDAIVAAIDARTRLVTVPTVTFSPGFITDVEPIAKACRESGCFFLVDAAQSVGVLHTDVRQMGVDGLAVATQKGLLGFYGLGFLYCRREWAERLAPAYLARFGVDSGVDAHETVLSEGPPRLMPGARRFDLGNFNYLGATATAAALDLLLELGTEAIEAYVRGLARRLATGFIEIGLPVCGGEPGPHLGNIVAVGSIGAGGHDSTEDPEMNDLYEHLTANRVRLSIRRGVLRFSLHLYNNEGDVDRVLELTRQWHTIRKRTSDPEQ